MLLPALPSPRGLWLMLSDGGRGHRWALGFEVFLVDGQAQSAGWEAAETT